MSGRQWLPLIGIALSVFIFNMSEFMPIGLLTAISDDFSISESKAGLIISVYAWAVAILSLPIMLLLRKMEYRRMLLMTVVLFAVFQFMSGISTSYWMLMASRLGVAVAHSVFWSIAAPLAVRVVDREHQKVALSLIATGTSLAMVIGLPLGRVIGLALGWRMAFIAMALAAAAVLVMLAIVFPRVENPGTFTVRRLPEIFRNRVLMGIYLVIAVYVTGYYTAYSYIEPFMLQTAGMSENMITVALIIFGLAGLIGSVLFTKKYGSARYAFIMSALTFSSLSMLALAAAAELEIAVLLLVILWGMSHTMFNISFQNETLHASQQDSAAIAMSLQSGIYNVGIAMGSILGGAVTDNLSVGDIGYVGGILGMAAAMFTAVVLIAAMKRRDASGAAGA
ncbi:MAG: MFS transporter [Candidatus Methanomethylophilus sp.]|jgi:DHA1 family L-arabinose/isopropyl-beta-D-thiogalactopyranoside export protein-like MFS transporter|nr:MFS transporter [Methanomethylophilus sp.]MCI2075606.1 MFS transporter [Methanomethylophilus sp.]MCI2092733.1 MFS transporter [Methanomethylophilus sp.]